MVYVILKRNFTANVFIKECFLCYLGNWVCLWIWFMAILCQRCIIDKDYNRYIKTIYPVWNFSVQYVDFIMFCIFDMVITNGSWLVGCNKPLFCWCNCIGSETLRDHNSSTPPLPCPSINWPATAASTSVSHTCENHFYTATYKMRSVVIQKTESRMEIINQRSYLTYHIYAVARP